MPSVFALSRPLVDGKLDYWPPYSLVGYIIPVSVVVPRLLAGPWETDAPDDGGKLFRRLGARPCEDGYGSE
jgi:hypothetical protein